MATQLADLLFYLIATAIVVAQVLILVSTARGMRFAAAPTDGAPRAAGQRSTLEWAYAIIPALALVVLLWASWRVMHPASIQVQGVAPSSVSRT